MPKAKPARAASSSKSAPMPKAKPARAASSPSTSSRKNTYVAGTGMNNRTGRKSAAPTKTVDSKPSKKYDIWGGA